MTPFVKLFELTTISSLVESWLNNFKAFTDLFKGESKIVDSCLFTIRKGEVLRIPSVYREVQVLSGVAWITVAGEDIILTREETSIRLNKDLTIVSALSDVLLILEGV